MIVIRSVSVPSAEREMYFSFACRLLTVQPEALQLIPALLAVLTGLPVASVTAMLTLVP
jgi:hypothetical protein